MEGTPFGSHYTLGEVIGRGGMGRVHRGRDITAERDVAIKLLREDLIEDSDVVSRFVRERDVVRSISNPNVVRVHDLVVEGDRLGIVMDLFAAGHLRRNLPPPLPPEQSARLLAQVAAGLAAVHAHGVVHRDLKPENVLVDRDDAGQVHLKLTDFGVSRLIGPSTTQLTGMIGTPGYLAPEVARGASPGPAADVYALGVMLYEWCTGKPPFRADHSIALIRAHAEDDVPAPLGAPQPLLDLLAASLAKDPQDRPTADDVARRLEEVAPELAGCAPFALSADAVLASRPGGDARRGTDHAAEESGRGGRGARHDQEAAGSGARGPAAATVPARGRRRRPIRRRRPTRRPRPPRRPALVPAATHVAESAGPGRPQPTPDGDHRSRRGGRGARGRWHLAEP